MRDSNSGTTNQAVGRRSVLLGLSGAGVAGAVPVRRRTALRQPVVETPRLRRPGKPSTTRLKGVGPTPPSAGVIVLNRLAFGPRPGDLSAFGSLGATPAQRLQAWLTDQLQPALISDPELDARLAAAGFESVSIENDPELYRTTLWDWYINDNAPSGNTSSSWPRDELERANFLRAMYSEKQLLEVMVDFWLNHFNVWADHSSFVRATYPHLELIVRQNAFGNFRQILGAVARSTAMLYYLDNYTSSNGGPNENFCRELFELHTLGAENYLGVLPQNQVPVDGTGRPIGYVDADVFEATRCFTGWSFSYGVSGDGDTGEFFYRSSWHDRFQKNVLGVFLPADQPDEKDGDDVLDALASHPGTGRNLARKLCRRLLSDDPPQSVVDAAAAVFTNQWQAGDQIAQAIEAIVLSPEFLTTWGEKIKRPFEITVGALRTGGADFTLRMDDGDTNDFLWRYDDTGQELFRWPAPNGYPDLRGAWSSMTPRVMTWRMVGWLVDFDDTSGDHYLDLVGQTPGGVRSANALADFWIQRVLGRPMEAADRSQIVQFMAQGINPDFDLDLADSDTADRLRSMVGLLFMSPDFLWR